LPANTRDPARVTVNAKVTSGAPAHLNVIFKLESWSGSLAARRCISFTFIVSASTKPDTFVPRSTHLVDGIADIVATSFTIPTNVVLIYTKTVPAR